MTTDLSQTFGTAAASSLQGRLPARPKPAEPSPDDPATDSHDQSVTEIPTPASPSATKQQTQASATTETKVQLSAYVLPHVPEAIEESKGERTNALVVFDAIEALQDRLPMLLESRHQPLTADPAGSGGLFRRSASDVRRTVRQHRRPWTFKVDPGNRAVLDELASRYGANSRSELVSVALEATYLPSSTARR